MSEENKGPWSKKFENRCANVVVVYEFLHETGLPVQVQISATVKRVLMKNQCQRNEADINYVRNLNIMTGFL